MKISIITVCFNSAPTIRDSIESVLAQTWPDVEYIIVDGASTDETPAIIDEYRDRIATVISEPDQGLYDAMNKGLARVTGDVVGILNSDDVYEDREALEAVAAAFAARPDSDMVFGDVVFVRPENPHSIVRHYGAARFRPWKLRFGWMPPHPGTFMRSTAFQRVGRYAIDYRIAADYEWFVRALLCHGLPITRIDRVLVRMRTGGASTENWRSRVVLNREIVRACRSNGIYTNLAMIMTKIPFKLLELVRHPARRT